MSTGRRPLVAGNWKMHGSRASNAALLQALARGLPRTRAAEVAVCPPAPYLELAAAALKDSDIALGAQNLCDQDQPGAFTGEVLGAMLRDVGCTFVIVGHSERRALYGESDEIVARKFRAAQKAQLVPILCVGETLQQREAGETERVLARQLDTVLEGCGVESFAQAVVAYEPVWAIGTGRTATPQQAQDAHAFLRARVAARDARIAAALRLLYGGSVKADNAQTLFGCADVDGGLIGGASLKAEEFLVVCAAARMK